MLAKALWFAACNGHVAAVRALLAHDADPDGYRDDEHGRKPRTARVLKAAGGKLRA